jgi:EAL domain-containing protein (putative c-di-GMP-specific phosphodiesterase class I)
VRAVVDGFGTAYPSLPHPGRFHVDSPNVDRSLVSRLGVKPEYAAIVSATISLAHALGWG